MLHRLSQLSAKQEALPLKDVGQGQAVATSGALGNLQYLFGYLLRRSHFALGIGRIPSGPQREYELLRVANLFAQLPQASTRPVSRTRAKAACHYEHLPKCVLQIEFAFYTLGGLGCRAQRGDRLLQIKLGFFERATHHCLLPRAAQVLDRFFGIRAETVVISELAQLIIDLAGGQSFNRGTDPFVKQLSELDEHRLVCHLLSERVLEDVLDIAGGRLFVDELGKLQIMQHAVQLVFRFSDHPLHQAQRKFSSDHRKRLQQILFSGRQTIDSRGENILHRRRNPQLCQWLDEFEASVAYQRPVIQQHYHRLFHEERVALGLFDNEPLEWNQIL